MSKTNQSEQLLRAVEQFDRKIARKLILEENVKLVGVNHVILCRFLKLAVQSRDAPLVQELLKLELNLNTPYGARILWIVAEDGDTEISSMLVRAGANLNTFRYTSLTQPSLLHVCAASKNPKKLELGVLMMDHGADVMARDIDEYTVLEYAVRNGNFSFAMELLKRDALVDDYVLWEAVVSSNTMEWILLFAEDYANDLTNRNERIANMFSWLCQFDCDEGETATWLKTLLDLEVPEVSVIYDTVLYGRIELVKLMVESHIDKSTKMMLLHAAVSLEISEIAEMLIEWGADIEYRMEFAVMGYTKGAYPIHIACAYGSLKNIELLLGLGVDINVTDDDGNTPFSLMMYIDSELNDISRLVIKNLVMASSKGSKISDNDLKIIHDDPNLLEFYEECMSELRSMKTLKILNTIPFHSIFTKNVKELSLLARYSNFVQNYEYKFLNGSFPLYSKDMNVIYRQAEKRKNLLAYPENALHETLDELLPALVVEKIVVYLYFSDIYL